MLQCNNLIELERAQAYGSKATTYDVYRKIVQV